MAKFSAEFSSGFSARVRRSGCLLPGLFTSFLWLKGRWPDLPGLACPLRAVTGIPCPTCFLTRATGAALQGNLGESLSLHLFGPPAAVALVALSVLAIRRRRLVIPAVRGRVVIATATALLLYWAGRIGLTYGLGIAAFPPG